MRYHDLFQTRGMHREHSFHTHTGSNAANGEHFPGASTAPGNADAFKQLNTFTGTFDNLHIDFQGIARTEIQECRNANFFFSPFQ